jgi:uncharacterized protein (DUF2345 family)
MANRSNATINQTLNYLLAKVNNLPPPPLTETLAQTLTAGNSAGTNDIDMNSNNITNIDTLSSTIGVAMNINGDDNLSLTAGGDLNITGDSNVNITASNNGIGISAYDGISIGSTTSGITLSTNGTAVGFTNCPIDMNSNDITNVATLSGNGISVLTINNGSENIMIGDGNGSITLSCPDDISLLSEDNIILTADDNITISNATGFTNSISLNTTTGDTTIASAFGSVNITSGNGDAGTSDISLFAVEGDIVLNTGGGYEVSSNSSITSSVGYTGKVYHTDQPTTALTYYLTFVQSGGVSGYYDPAFDSATLTYNPSTNLLAVAGLQLSGSTITGTFSAGVLTLGCNESSSRQFQIAITANITGLSLSNRRTNGVYTCSIYNVSGSTWTISNVLTGSASNKTDYASPISVANGEFAVLTARTLLTNGTAYNYVSVMKFA